MSYRIGCCIPGASFMPEGIRGTGTSALFTITNCAEKIIRCGFDFAEVGVGMIMTLTQDELSSLIAENLPIETANSFIPGEYKIVAPGAVAASSPLTDFLHRSLERLASIGIKIVVFGSGFSRRIPDTMTREEGYRYICEFLRVVGEIAYGYGITVAIEPLRASECNAINLTSDARALVRSVPMPSVQYLADAFHMCEGAEAPDALASADFLPVHIHISESPGRVYPGAHGGEYLSAFADALKRTSYQGRIAVECGFNDFDSELSLGYGFVQEHFNK